MKTIYQATPVLCLVLLLASQPFVTAAKGMEDYSPEEVLEHFFDWMNQKNLTKMESLLTKDRKGVEWDLDNLIYEKVKSVQDKTHEMLHS